MSHENGLVERIEKMERANRRIRWFSALLIVLITLLLFAWRMERKDVVQAKEFILKDDSGAVVARLSHTNWGTCLELTGKGQASEASLCVGDDYGSSLQLTNQHGADRAFLSAGLRMVEGPGTLSPGLVIAKDDGKSLISVSLGTETKLVVGQGTEKNSLVVLATPQMKPTIRILDSTGKTLWTTP